MHTLKLKDKKNLYSKFPPYFLICTRHWTCCNSGACKKERGVYEEIKRLEKLNENRNVGSNSKL